MSERLDRVVALRDRELGLPLQGLAPGYAANVASAPVPPPVPPPGEHLPTASTLGIPGTPIVSGFLEDMGEYNGELAGRNALPIYEKMRRGDGQVRATLAACKLPVLSAKWEVIASDHRAIGRSRKQWPDHPITRFHPPALAGIRPPRPRKSQTS